MRFDKFTIKSQELIQNSQNLATQHNNPQIEPEHLLGCMLREPEGIVNSMLKKLGASSGSVAQEVAQAIERLPKVDQPSDVYISTRTKSVLDAAFSEAAKMKDQYVSLEHILLAITDEKAGDAVKILAHHGVTRDSILKVLIDIRGSQRITDPNPEERKNSAAI
jgi:ATP-dependent Clp protease ATP-binding subunit ClpB